MNLVRILPILLVGWSVNIAAEEDANNLGKEFIVEFLGTRHEEIVAVYLFNGADSGYEKEATERSIHDLGAWAILNRYAIAMLPARKGILLFVHKDKYVEIVSREFYYPGRAIRRMTGTPKSYYEKFGIREGKAAEPRPEDRDTRDPARPATGANRETKPNKPRLDNPLPASSRDDPGE